MVHITFGQGPPQQGNTTRDRPPPHGYGHGLWMVNKLGEDVYIEGNNRERKKSIRQHNKALDDAAAGGPDTAPVANPTATTATASTADPSTAADIAELETTIKCAKKNGLDVAAFEVKLQALRAPPCTKTLTAGQAKHSATTLEQQHRRQCGVVITAQKNLGLQE